MTDQIPVSRAASPARLAALRAELSRRKLAGFIVPLQDEHQGEWVPPHAQRLLWLTAFTGSAGVAIVLPNKAAIFVDGRYTLQVRQQVDTSLFETHHLIDEPPGAWLAQSLKKGEAVAYDPWLHTLGDIERFRSGCAKAGGTLVTVDSNPVDAVWTDRPAPPLAPMVRHELAYAGESSADKRARLAADLKKDGVDAAVLTQPDSIAWLLNIRGGDLAYTPVTLSFAVLRADGSVELFVDPRKVDDGMAAWLGNTVTMSPPDALGTALTMLGNARQKVLVDPLTAASWIIDQLERSGASVVRGNDPCALPKACKNAVELEGIRNAHRRDGAALTRFMAWLDTATRKGKVNEVAAAERLQAMREQNDLFKRPSFPTIAGSGPNGAIVHYRATADTNRELEGGELFLVDSGAQYLDGTTDVTRTISIGTPSAEQRDRFTRVLKGHIALAMARFPKGTSGSQLDALARMPLWQAGLDFDHGTGHGVGAYLNVHEGPHRISKMPNREALRPGMVVSNEPGYYKTGAYGIRIENLVAVREAGSLDGAERATFEFETLTLAPIDRNLVEPSMLGDDELDWFNDYHARVRAAVAPQVDADTKHWLEGATAPVTRA